MIPSMSSDIFTIIDRLNSRQLRANLAQLEQRRSALIVLLRAAIARERKANRASRQEVRRGRP
jgi:hypothetical protein